MSVILLVALLTASPVRAQGAEDYEARLTEVKGEVTVYTADEPEGVPGEAEMPLEPGDRVTTGADASAEIGLDGAHAVSLRADSDFTLSSPAKAGLELKLALGSLLAKVAALASGQAFRVRTPTAVAAVRGTEFGVEASADDTAVGVFDEGRVEVEAGGAVEVLKSNEETTVARGGRPAFPTGLRRLVKHRRFMREQFRQRARVMRQRWKPLPPAQRRELRRKMLGRMKEKRAQRLERMRQKQQRQGLRRGGPRPPRPDQRKMERRREEIRRRRGRP